jgi:hypothetical protein
MNLPSGLRIPLAIDASMLIGGLIAVTLMWSDIRSIKADRQQITDGRLVRLEEQNKAQDERIAELKSQVQAQWRRRSGP